MMAAFKHPWKDIPAQSICQKQGGQWITNVVNGMFIQDKYLHQTSQIKHSTEFIIDILKQAEIASQHITSHPVFNTMSWGRTWEQEDSTWATLQREVYHIYIFFLCNFNIYISISCPLGSFSITLNGTNWQTRPGILSDLIMIWPVCHQVILGIFEFVCPEQLFVKEGWTGKDENKVEVDLVWMNSLIIGMKAKPPVAPQANETLRSETGCIFLHSEILLKNLPILFELECFFYIINF